MNPKKTKQMTAKISERRRCTSISISLLVGVQRDEDEVDELDEDERHDDAADSIDQDVSAQNDRGLRRAKLHASKSQGNESDNHQRVENDGRQDGTLRAVQPHQVERLERLVVQSVDSHE